MRNFGDEMIYISKACALRFACMKEDAKYYGVTIKQVAPLVGIPASTIYLYNMGYHVPTLNRYLRLADFFEWDLSEDVNYAYATRKYSPRETGYRVMRLGFRTWRSFSRAIGYEPKSGRVHRSLCYAEQRTSLSVYARALYYISREEHKRGFKDAIILEE